MPRLMRTMARTAVIAGTATAVSNKVSQAQYNKAVGKQQQAEAQQAAAQQAAAEQAAAAAPAEPDYMVELQKLAQLKDQGIISEADFEAKKKQLLGL